MKHKIWFAILMTLFLMLAAFSLVAAQELPPNQPSDNAVNAIAKQLYCPVCENVPLDVCPTQACAQWRELIREKLSQGWNEEQIKTYFVQQYGDRVLATPPARGLNWLVYIIPPIAILAGVFILYRVFQSWKRPGAETFSSEPISGPPADKPEDDYEALLEEQLRQR